MSTALTVGAAQKAVAESLAGPVSGWWGRGVTLANLQVSEAKVATHVRAHSGQELRSRLQRTVAHDPPILWAPSLSGVQQPAVLPPPCWSCPGALARKPLPLGGGGMS